MNPPRMLEVTRDQWERMSAIEREGVSIIRTAAGVRLPVYHPLKTKGIYPMNLTLILSTEDPETKEGGLLADTLFEAGPVTIKVYSVLTHRYNSVVTVNARVPSLSIIPTNEPLSFDFKPLEVEAFSALFAKALQQAQIHQMKVSKWIDEHINESIRQAIQQNTFNIREAIFPCASGHDWEKHIDPAKPTKCSKCAAERNPVTGEISYPDARGRFV